MPPLNGDYDPYMPLISTISYSDDAEKYALKKWMLKYRVVQWHHRKITCNLVPCPNLVGFLFFLENFEHFSDFFHVFVSTGVVESAK